MTSQMGALARLMPFTLAALTLIACNGKDADPSDDSGAGDDTEAPVADCSADEECDAWQICEAEACEDGDRNNGIDEATSIIWEDANRGYLETDSDKDYYSFNAEGGEFIRVTTENVNGNEALDTVLSLYSPSGKLHAQENDHPVGPVSTYDSVLFAYLPTAGTWTLAVETLDGVGVSSFQYELVLRETGGHTRETDAFDDASYDVDAEARVYYSVGVLLEEPGDTDWIEVSLPYDECPVYLYGSAFASGTDAVPTAELYLPDETRLLRKENFGPDGAALYFEVDGGEAMLGISDAQGGGGDNYWTFVFVSIGERGYPYEKEEEDNGYLDFANGLDFEWETNSSGQIGTARAWGVIDEAGDEDWYRIEVDDNHYVHLLGTADSVGSLLDAAVEVYDVNEQLVAEGTYGDDDFPDLYNLGPLDGGVYYLRIYPEDPDDEAEGPEAYYRFAAYQSDYEVAEP